MIELLALTLILGVIIEAVPKILDVINKSKGSTASSSIKLVKDAIKIQIATRGNFEVLEIKNKEKYQGVLNIAIANFKEKFILIRKYQNQNRSHLTIGRQ